MAKNCFVPLCKGHGVISFPKDAQAKSLWLQKLSLGDKLLDTNSLLCLKHFNSSDVQINENGTVIIKNDVLPIKRNSYFKIEDIITEEVSADEKSSCYSSDESVHSLTDEDADKSNEKENEELRTGEDDVAQILDVCRACMSKENLESNIYQSMDKDHTVGSLFMLCAYPISVFGKDKLSKKICRDCLEVIKIIHKFRKKCMETNSKLKLRRHDNKKKETDQSTNQFRKRVRTDSKSNISYSKFIKLYDKEPYDPMDSSINMSCSDFEVVFEAQEKSTSVKCKDTVSVTNLDEIERNLEQIHGERTKVTLVTSDVATVEDVLNTLEENDIVKEKIENITKSSLPLQVLNTPTKETTLKTKDDNILANIKLPKDVKIKPVEIYQSELGEFKSVYRLGVFETTFLEAAGYLYEFGLMKANIRHLRCTVPSCSAHALQKSLSEDIFEDKITVTTPHNHSFLTEQLKTKEIFLCIMRKKMQVDRSLNIRNIYEQACKQDPTIREVVPLRNVINEICRHQLTTKTKVINSFESFFNNIEDHAFEKLHFTHNHQQFYQEKFYVEDEDSMAVLFGNIEIISQVSSSTIMYIDASFRIDTKEDFKYQLVTVLVWIEDSYYPILYILVNKKSQQLYRQIFSYLANDLAPKLRPLEIITDYEANLYYALAEIYTDCNIGGSVFYYTQNLYKKVCSLNLSKDLETNSYFRNIYHMLLMLPLLPVNTILDGLNHIEIESKNLNIFDITKPLFEHVRDAWITTVTPELFCVHKLESRINENVIAPFKKLRDFLLLSKGKSNKSQVTITHIIEKLIELEDFLRATYSKPDKKSFGRDLSSFQKKNVLRAWHYIEDHPKIEINNFFSKVLGYIKCMENQLWIWGFYRYKEVADDVLINASHFSIINPEEDEEQIVEDENAEVNFLEYEENVVEQEDQAVVMEAVVDQNGVLQPGTQVIVTEDNSNQPQQFESAFLRYVYD